MSSRQTTYRWRRAAGTAVGTVLILGAGLGAPSGPVRAAENAGGSPDQVGSWTAPFEEEG
jgi:hypothetical protein